VPGENIGNAHQGPRAEGDAWATRHPTDPPEHALGCWRHAIIDRSHVAIVENSSFANHANADDAK
jgi:hypothetical protein